MPIVNVILPDSVHKVLKVYTKEDDNSISQFITSAVIEKLTSLDTVNYLEDRSLRGSEEKYLKVLKKAPHAKPREDDAIE